MQPTRTAISDISLRHWRSFEAAASLGSFSRAADALGVTQPAISMQLRQLEEAVGFALFDKQVRPMALTSLGQALLLHARAILAEVRLAEDAAVALASGSQEFLRVGVVEPANYFAPNLVQAFGSAHPQLRVRIAVDRRDALLDQLAQCRLDLAIMGFPPAEADVEALTFAHHPHVVVANANHPLAVQAEVAWGELEHHPVVLREPGSSTRRFMENVWHARGLRPPVSAELQGNETVKHAVMAGLGISLMSAHPIQVELAARRLSVLRLQDMPSRLDWCVLHRRERPLSQAARMLRDFLVERGPALTACRVA
jgi:LysR family transcriptional regulator, low CO2-responsive transcriptional regulator